MKTKVSTNGVGPHGVGDPDDLSLRKVEKEVLIPKVMRDRTKTEKCVEQVRKFEKCCKENGLLMVITCRQENSELKSCQEKWYKDTNFQEECKNLYLKDRTEYRRTGITKSQREKMKN